MPRIRKKYSQLIMSSVIKIKKGLDINLSGKALLSVEDADSRFFAIQPTDFIGLLPRLLVHEGEAVKVGTPLLHNKHDERIQVVSPVSGTVSAIRRGEKRRLESIVIESDGRFESLEYTTSSLDAENIRQKMLESGLWPLIRQRPYSVIANPDQKPKAFYVSAFDTSPLAPDLDFVIEHFPDSFQKGLDILSILSDGRLHLSVHAKKNHSEVFLKARNVTLHRFSGPHPSGNIGTQINKIDPIVKGDIVWYCYPQDVINIGRFFSSGRLDFTRIFAAAGSSLLRPHYFKTRLGAQVKALAGDGVKDNCRFISGNVLTGKNAGIDGFVGFYHNMLTVIPEGDQRHEMLGWIWPGFRKFSVSRTFPSGFVPSTLHPSFELDTNMHGEHRPFVVTGMFETVFPFDIYPLQLIKACMVEDIDLMENLGIYEVDEEDFALCEFIDTSKNNIQQIIRKGLDLMRRENE